MKTTFPILVMSLCAGTALAQSTDPRIASWVFNIDGRHGTSTNATVDARVSTILADTQQVRYDANYVYINATSVPSYAVGPFPGNPGLPSNQNSVNRLPRNPTVAVTKTNTGLGTIGVLINGVGVYNASDGRSYNNANVWRQNAGYFEGGGFDAALGHPGPGGGYHHHVSPISLLAQLGDRSDVHSPLIGYAFDGFPIYGSYAYANTNGTGAIIRMTSSYRTRNITTRTNGPVIGPSTIDPNGGINLSGPQPLGAYIEDYEYVAGFGTLDRYNGRTCVTPEFPNGTYAYFVTVDANGAPAYPFIVGPQYNGVVVPQMGTTVPAGVSSQSFGSSFPCTTIWTQPSSVAATCAAANASFEVKVRHGALATYQWRKGGTPLSNGGRVSGATTAILTISNAVSTDAGTYDCVVTAPGTCGSITTSGAVLSFPASCCNSIDFNGDSLFPDDSDLVDFLSVLAGGPCSTNDCDGIDFNNDGLFPDDNDLVAFLRVLAGGNC